MTVPRWDANTFDRTRRHAGEPTPPTAMRPRGRKRKAIMLSVGALVALAALVSAQQIASGDEPIGICHATSSAENPYVFLVVKRDGFEHGHHRHHEGDFFPSALSQGCTGDTPVVPGNETDEPAPADNETEEPADNETEEPETPADDGNETETPAEDANETETPDDGSDGNATEEPTNETEEPEPVDVSVRQTAAQDDFEVILTLRVASLGPGQAQEVALEDQLPDVRRSWRLSGDDSADCVLDGRSLSCWFVDEHGLRDGHGRLAAQQRRLERQHCGPRLLGRTLPSPLFPSSFSRCWVEVPARWPPRRPVQRGMNCRNRQASNPCTSPGHPAEDGAEAVSRKARVTVAASRPAPRRAATVAAATGVAALDPLIATRPFPVLSPRMPSPGASRSGLPPEHRSAWRG